jgi:hypothetical protein
MTWIALAMLVITVGFGAALFSLAAANVARARKADQLHHGWTLDASGWTHEELGK